MKDWWTPETLVKFSLPQLLLIDLELGRHQLGYLPTSQRISPPYERLQVKGRAAEDYLCAVLSTKW